MKRLVQAGLTGALLFSMSVPVAAAAPLNLRDVPLGDPDRAAIEFLNEHDVIYGSPDGTFRPDSDITRGEILKIALEASGEGHAAFLAPKTGAGRFSDVPETHTLGSYIAYASDQAYINGYPDGTFHPDAEVTRAEAAKILARILHAPGSRQASPYTDLGGSSLAPFIHDVYGANWYQPTPPRFNPNIPITRREVAQIAYRSLVATAASAQAGAPLSYDAAMAEPTTLPSDWQAGSEQGLSFAYPAGWFSESQAVTIQGKTALAMVTTPIPVSDAEGPTFMLFSIDVADLLTFQQNEAGPDYSPPIARTVAIDTADGTRNMQVMEFHVPADGLVFDFWIVSGKVIMAAYDEKNSPGLTGTFDRFIQHAIELNGTAA